MPIPYSMAQAGCIVRAGVTGTAATLEEDAIAQSHACGCK